MRRFIYFFVAITALSLSGCYNDDDVWNAINDQEERIASLEAWQQTTNSNIAAIQAIVNENDYITDVKPITKDGETVGYTISFLRQGDVTIYHGEKGDKGEQGDKGDQGEKGEQGEQGEKGETPVISVVKQNDGRWYWTLNGELLKDENGNLICASGKDGADGNNGNNGSNGVSAPAPMLKAGSALTDADVADREATAVYLSVDGGKTWVKVSGPKGDTGAQGDSMFKDVIPGDKYVTFILNNADGTTFQVPIYTRLTLKYGETIIENGTLNVPLPTDGFTITYDHDADYALNMHIIDKNEPMWGITTSDGVISFPEKDEPISATIVFTMTAKDNQTFYYQVTVSVVSPVITNQELIEKLGLVTNGEGNADVKDNAGALQATSLPQLIDAGLTSVEGIEYFTELKELDLTGNSVSSLNISTLTKLEVLDVSDNPLTSLDVSQQTELKTLKVNNCFNRASRSVATTFLDVSKNTALETLECNQNGFTTLDVSNNTKLKVLSCHTNQLTELALQNASNLEHLICHSNKLQTLDISPCLLLKNVQCGNQEDIVLSLIVDSSQKSAWENTWKAMDTNTNVILSGEETPADPDKTITNLALISRIETQHKVTFTRNADGYVDVEENKAILESITDLTISYGYEIESLQGIEHLINLETVWCSFINATTLDVSRNAKLKKLWITLVNNLKEAKLGNLPELADLELTGFTNKILTEELDISGCPNLQRLCFNNTNLTTLDVSHCSQLRALSCYNNQLTTLDIRNNPNLTSLSCYGNNMATLDITQNPLLEKLTCGNQNNVSNLVLTLSDDQKATWESTWKALENNTNVILFGEETPTDPDGNKGQLPGLDNGGVF